ncbi:hypothetical protein I6I10_02295 [Corynebacterium glucuronolyticum]|uniref:Uncharacterized protein n=1 Tax=Corynebacterium glucuronolyticum TaxID=39791 RepID=A0A7T4JVE1_9CORY|nr:hypothetical protein [Corynebacterium glucuronolyticum]QQB46787.1 hypothetical protein I6I10_02295 [Corynebacterium glucuronolyticum]WKD62378.1 hypothetical protein CGLUCO_00425 [Corynebacterium glucuronolyticum DSM 44120]SMB81998.1 hypothetical protein SAMN05660745_02535 [Corynebacterium glucuronolyticum]
MDLLGTFSNKVLGSVKPWDFYTILASLTAMLTLFAALGCGTLVDPNSTSQDEALQALDRTPLGVLFQVFDYFSIPTNWITDVGTYFANDTPRANLIGLLAVVTGCVVMTMLTPDRTVYPTPTPSVQACTWFIAFAVAAQSNPTAGFWNRWTVLMVIFLVGFLIGRELFVWFSFCGDEKDPFRLNNRPERLIIDAAQLSVTLLTWIVPIVNLVARDTPFLKETAKKNQTEKPASPPPESSETRDSEE